MKTMSKGTAIAATILLSAAGTLGIASAAQAASDHSVSIAAWCEKHVSSGNYWVKSKAVNTTNRWDGWKCAQANGGFASVNVAEACREQYKPQAVAVVVNNSASGWRCRF